MQHKTTWLNGRFLPAGEALIPVADRGFRFGDGLFETVRLVNGAPYQWPLHMARLAAGLESLRIPAPAVDWLAVAKQLVAANDRMDGFLRIAVSRGVGSLGYLPDAGIEPTCVVEIMPASPLPKKPFTLWQSSHARNPNNHKLSQGVTNTLALLEARDQGCDEALMLSPDGQLCEAASANLFWVSDNQLYTPALASGCLAGTTRAALMRLTGVREIIASTDALAAAQSVFISNVRLGIWPVAAIAPHGWQYDTGHPLIAELTEKLNAERAASAWPAA